MSIQRLKGKVAIITGAASGIGQAAARLFALEGATVIIADVQDELGSTVAASIGADRCAYKHCDVTNEKQVESTVQDAMQTHGRLDIMFSNAGIIGPETGFMELDMSGLDRVMAVNLRGAAAAIKHAARAMVGQGTRGSIICTASAAATQGGLGPAAYTASKHAALGLVRSAAGELGAFGVRVNCVSPFGVATGMTCKPGGPSASQLEGIMSVAGNLKGVALKASDVAEAALFLASDESKYISGHNLVVDGSFTTFSSGYATMKQIAAEAGFGAGN